MHILDQKIHIPVKILRWYYGCLGIDGTDIKNGISDKELEKLSEDGISCLEELLQVKACNKLSDEALELAKQLNITLEKVYGTKNKFFNGPEERISYMMDFGRLLGSASGFQFVDVADMNKDEGIELFMKRRIQVLLLAIRDMNKMDFIEIMTAYSRVIAYGKDSLVRLSQKYPNLASLINISIMSANNLDEVSPLDYFIFESANSHLIDIDKLHSIGMPQRPKVIDFSSSSGERTEGAIFISCGGKQACFPLNSLPDGKITPDAIQNLLNNLGIEFGGIPVRFVHGGVDNNTKIEFDLEKGKVVILKEGQQIMAVDMAPNVWSSERVGVQIEAKKRGLRKVRIRKIGSERPYDIKNK